jgi:ATP-dependent protease ClpP protease subunit
MRAPDDLRQSSQKKSIMMLFTGHAGCPAALLLCAGEPGERTASPNSRIALYTEDGQGWRQQLKDKPSSRKKQ